MEMGQVIFPWAISVGNNDMHFHIFDASDVEVFSVVEDDFGGISSKEIGKLEADPTP